MSATPLALWLKAELNALIEEALDQLDKGYAVDVEAQVDAFIASTCRLVGGLLADASKATQ